MLNCWPRKKTLQLSIHSTFVARSLTLNWGSKASRHRYPVWNVGPCMSVCYTCCIFTKSTTLSWQSHRHGAAYDASTRLVVASLEERSWVVRETSSPELIFHHIPEAFEFFFFPGIHSAATYQRWSQGSRGTVWGWRSRCEQYTQCDTSMFAVVLSVARLNLTQWKKNINSLNKKGENGANHVCEVAWDDNKCFWEVWLFFFFLLLSEYKTKFNR